MTDKTDGNGRPLFSYSRDHETSKKQKSAKKTILHPVRNTTIRTCMYVPLFENPNQPTSKLTCGAVPRICCTLCSPFLLKQNPGLCVSYILTLAACKNTRIRSVPPDRLPFQPVSPRRDNVHQHKNVQQTGDDLWDLSPHCGEGNLCFGSPAAHSGRNDRRHGCVCGV